jgi:arginine/lysine/ornithine decarboxylase
MVVGKDFFIRERITKEILNYIEYAKAKGCSMTGPEDPEILHLNVLA